ncbi:hypothetical protein HDU87_006654 [Geranomyces variabilis]|uniref:Ankyrin repeat protein n=1 Tax=Geranomyces variabilis TaxID=109894 RepID=A0AAD5TF10_9FUNG|nr:hypothetical protein HDU87_006654 [Geranomyces variabilis]
MSCPAGILPAHPPTTPFAARISTDLLVHLVAGFLPCCALARFARTCRRVSACVSVNLLVDAYLRDAAAAAAAARDSRAPVRAFLALFAPSRTTPCKALHRLADGLLPTLKFGYVTWLPAIGDLFAYPDIFERVLQALPEDLDDWVPYYLEAFRRNLPSIVTLLIKSGRVVDEEDGGLQALLAHAIHLSGSTDCAEVLLKHGASLDAEVDVQPAPWDPAEIGNVPGHCLELAVDCPFSAGQERTSAPPEILSRFLARCNRLTLDLDGHGGRILLKAIVWGTPAHVRLLLAAGCDIDKIRSVDIRAKTLDLYGPDSEMYELVRTAGHMSSSAIKKLKVLELLSRNAVDIDDGAKNDVVRWVRSRDVRLDQEVDISSPDRAVLLTSRAMEPLIFRVARSSSAIAPAILHAFAQTKDAATVPSDRKELLLFEAVMSGSPDTLGAVKDFLGPSFLNRPGTSISWVPRCEADTNYRGFWGFCGPQSFGSCLSASLWDRAALLTAYMSKTDLLPVFVEADPQRIAGGEAVRLFHDCHGRGVDSAQRTEVSVIEIIKKRQPDLSWIVSHTRGDNRDPLLPPSHAVEYYATEALVHSWTTVFSLLHSQHPDLDLSIVKPVWVALIANNIDMARNLVLSGVVEDDLISSGFHQQIPRDNPLVARCIRDPDMTPQQWFDRLKPCFELVLDGLKDTCSGTDQVTFNYMFLDR